jgi:hypothetical protein
MMNSQIKKLKGLEMENLYFKSDLDFYKSRCRGLEAELEHVNARHVALLASIGMENIPDHVLREALARLDGANTLSDSVKNLEERFMRMCKELEAARMMPE